MGETLDQTRLEIEAQRVQLQRTADRLKARARRTVDLKAKFKENPALFVGLGAGAIFLVAGGPMRAARFARRRLLRSTPEKAYDTLPKPMQSWVDTLAGSVGPRAERARETLAEELVKWRQAPLQDRKVRKELTRQMVEGPPGPRRTTWKALEAAAAILSTALARRAVERFLSNQPPIAPAPAAAPASPDASATAGDSYSAMSAGTRSSDEPPAPR